MTEAARWLLLIHQIPPKPDYFRVKVRRRLQKLGAAPLKNSVYVLPNTEEALEDFLWLAQEIHAEGGEAVVSEASFVAGITNAELEEMVAARRETIGGASGAPGGEQVAPGRTWVTRAGVQVDRIASAWLIRRFIDPDARFKFAPARGYRPETGELRFDMFEAEYTHEGARCTFEVLVQRFGLASDSGLGAIAEIVHDIDCKDERFGRPETAGVAALLGAITARHPDDDLRRLEQGGALFADLYDTFRERGG
ncbi:MAG: chromate resistance protein ChrB domain-containing protein [Gemmatimonadales bacterium]